MVDVATSCRTCMKTSDRTLVDLFQTIKIEENLCVELSQALMECTSMIVSREDGLPQKVCNECLQLLQLSYTFRTQALNAENEFKKYFLCDTKFKEELEDIKNDYVDNNYGDSFLDKTESFECTKCNKQYMNERKYLKHMSSHEISIACHICNKIFHKQNSLDKHLAKHEDNFSTEQLLLNTMVAQADLEVKTEINENLYSCSECEMTFHKLRSLAMHKKKHKVKDSEEKNLICDTCNKTFSNKYLLQRHIKVHNEGSERRRYYCSKCPKSYTRCDQLKAHLNKHNNVSKHTCTYCNKAFAQHCTLKDHLRIHTRETPFLCAQCGKGFKSRSNLRQHAMTHTGVKPYTCTFCPMTFATKGQVSSHMVTHTGAHPYACETCGATFTKPHSLKKHSLIHTGLRPFVCDDCDRSFTCKDHLKRHQRIHTGEKPYQCKYCERAFSQSNDLIKHTRSHVGQNLYQCSVCQAKFRLLTELKQHYPVHFVNGNTPTIPIGDSQYPVLINRGNPDPDKDKSVKDLEKTISIAFNNMLEKRAEIHVSINDSNLNITSDKT